MEFFESRRKAITFWSIVLGLASLACMISAFAVSANAEYDGYADGFYYVESDEIVRLRRCTRTGDVEIPSMLNGKEVTEIGYYDYVHENFFTDPASVTSVTLPNTITQIYDNTFVGCSSLEEVNIPSSVVEIGDHVFEGCSSLEKVFISSSVTSIGSGIFSGCTALREIAMPFFSIVKYPYHFNREYMSFSAFFESRSEYMKVTEGMMINLSCSEDDLDRYFSDDYYNNNGYFEDCMATEINLTGNLRVIGSSTFEDCTNLVRVTIPSTVTEISGHAFSGCTALKSVTMPANLSSMGGSAFSDCTALEEIALPDGVQTIGNYAFSGCTNLRSIIIPLSVTEISRDAFENCPRLTIYAEAESKPEDWVDGYVFENYLDWNPDDRPVIWGYRK